MQPMPPRETSIFEWAQLVVQYGFYGFLAIVLIILVWVTIVVRRAAKKSESGTNPEA
jgi:ABC-type multidrug transport system permease subunit